MSMKLRCSGFGLIVLLTLALTYVSPTEKHGIFGKFWAQAEAKVANMTIDEKIAQTLIVQQPATGAADELREYQFGGYIFFAEDFRGKTTAEVQQMIANLQSAAKIPLLTAVDEEGGIVTRVSRFSQLAPSRFLSPSQLYQQGGLDLIRQDTLQKSQLLSNLGLNLNLAPVVDVSTSPQDYMYSRSLGQNAALTADYAKTVIAASREFSQQIARNSDNSSPEASQLSNSGVSYTLKHFPGYGNNSDTHVGASVDTRDLDDILSVDLLPFRAGIESGAEAVLVSHNIVTAIDSDYPASLSAPIHRLLRNDLGFTGVIITDEILMGALESYDQPAVRALEVGNDLIITKDGHRTFAELKSAFDNRELDENLLNQAVTRILAWKYYKNLL